MKELSPLFVRVAGLFLIVFTVSKLPVHSMAYSIRPEYGILSYSIPSIIPLLAGILLFWFPKTISKNILDVIPESINIENPKVILYIGCVLIGVVFMFFSISDLMYHISSGAFIYLFQKYEFSLDFVDVPGFVATIAEVLFSWVLVFRTNTFLLFVSRWKNGL
ncbi:MAG: hypothetical protein ABW148_17260 [Sedimenticola sp.]